MGKAAARSGDKLVVKSALTHKWTTSSSPPTTSPYTCNFSGTISSAVSSDVLIGGAAAVIQNDASESGAHTGIPAALPAGSWDTAPNDTAKVTAGSGSVFINGKPAVRDGDAAKTCATDGAVQVQNAASATVFIGD